MPISRTTRRMGSSRAFALLLSVLLITLLIATSAELVTVTSTQSIVAGRRHRALAHELAVDSALLLLADRLLDNEDRPSELVRSIDERGHAAVTFTIGSVKVDCALFDDAAKLNPLLFQRDDQQTQLTRKLTTLAHKALLLHGGITVHHRSQLTW